MVWQLDSFATGPGESTHGSGEKVPKLSLVDQVTVPLGDMPAGYGGLPYLPAIVMVHPVVELTGTGLGLQRIVGTATVFST